MNKMITLREANQGFARMVKDVQAGDEFIITRNGTPVAKLIPIPGRRVLTPAQEAAWERTQARWADARAIDPGPLDRDSLYDDDGDV